MFLIDLHQINHGFIFLYNSFIMEHLFIYSFIYLLLIRYESKLHFHFWTHTVAYQEHSRGQ